MVLSYRTTYPGRREYFAPVLHRTEHAVFVSCRDDRWFVHVHLTGRRSADHDRPGAGFCKNVSTRRCQNVNCWFMRPSYSWTSVRRSMKHRLRLQRGDGAIVPTGQKPLGATPLFSPPQASKNSAPICNEIYEARLEKRHSAPKIAGRPGCSRTRLGEGSPDHLARFMGEGKGEEEG